MKLKHDIQDLINSKTISTPPVSPPYVTNNPLPNYNALPPPCNVNYLGFEKAKFDPSLLITSRDEPTKPYKFPEDAKICIIQTVEEDWIEGGEEELEFEEDIANGVVVLNWWDPAEPTDDSV